MAHSFAALRSRAGLTVCALTVGALALACAAIVAFHHPRLPAPRPAARPAPARLAAAPLRIYLHSQSGRAALTLTTGAKSRAIDPSTGQLLATLPPVPSLEVSADYTNQVVVITGGNTRAAAPEIRLASDSGRIGIGARRYPGALIFRLLGTGVEVIDEVDVERYLDGVLPGEIPASFAPEAQKALAVAARTYSLRNRGKHAAEGADLCDGVHCQMYVGETAVSPAGLQAARATRGLCAWYEGELACTFYSADCGGQTASAADVPLPDMPSAPPAYLRPVRDRAAPGAPDYCRASPHHWWTADLPTRHVEAALDQDPETYVGALKRVAFTARDSTGRVTAVRLEGEDPVQGPVARTITGWAFRRAVGPRRVRSTLMNLEWETPDRIHLSGAGNGHGLGLCQIGANGMAGAPYHRNFRDILQHYFPGTTIAPVPTP